jgi:signal transduction histidine kinase
VKNRFWPVLLLAFGALVVLIALSGLGTLRRARDAYRQVTALNERYHKTERLLNDLASGIQLSGLLTRDYLLDPSNVSAAEYRSRLVSVHAEMQGGVRDLTYVLRSEDLPALRRLKEELEGYWASLDPLFEWTPQEKIARSWTFLRREVLPRRRAAVAIANEIRSLTEANTAQQRKEIDREQAEISIYITRMLAVTLSLGLFIAGTSTARIIGLERRAAEQARRTEAAEEELRRLSRQLVRAQEEERKSISRELHDEGGQMLTALRVELRNLQEVRGAPGAQFDEHLEDAKQLAELSLRTVRDMAMLLRPAMLDDLGLGAAVQWQARQFSRHTGVPVNVDIDGILAGLPDRHRTCVYRLVQEALTNCAKHAGAKTIRVSIDGGPEQLSVAVQDDGAGFDENGERGLGLIGIQERVRELSGSFSISSAPGKGTVLSARIPVPKEGTEA